MNDVTMDALKASLRGLSARQRAIADNIANIETPGYLAKRVQFEDSLAGALRSGSDASTVRPMTERSLEAVGMNGNNVVLEQETLASIDTNLRYQLSIEAVNNKFRLMRASMRGSA
jgi:flagellar basal-body rod protein FlgB